MYTPTAGILYPRDETTRDELPQFNYYILPLLSAINFIKRRNVSNTQLKCIFMVQHCFLIKF